MNRDYQSFEWFIELLGELEMQQLNTNTDRFIGIHLYMTSSKVVQQVQPLEYSISSKTTSMKRKIKDFSLKLNPGRPDFDAVICLNFTFLIC